VAATVRLAIDKGFWRPTSVSFISTIRRLAAELVGRPFRADHQTLPFVSRMVVRRFAKGRQPDGLADGVGAVAGSSAMTIPPGGH
jgi:hypothetical protein